MSSPERCSGSDGVGLCILTSSMLPCTYFLHVPGLVRIVVRISVRENNADLGTCPHAGWMACPMRAFDPQSTFEVRNTGFAFPGFLATVAETHLWPREAPHDWLSGIGCRRGADRIDGWTCPRARRGRR